MSQSKTETKKVATVPLTKEEPPHTLQQKAEVVTESVAEKLKQVREELMMHENTTPKEETTDSGSIGAIDFTKALDPLVEEETENEEAKHPTFSDQFEDVKHVVVEKAEDVKMIVVEMAEEVRKNVGEMIEKVSKQEHEATALEEQKKESNLKYASPEEEHHNRNRIEEARSWITHKVEDFVDMIQAEKSPKGTEKRLSKDLVEVVPDHGGELDKEPNPMGRGTTTSANQGGFQEKVEQARSHGRNQQ